MEFWPLFMMASVPVAEIMLIGTLGAFLASGYVNILSPTRKVSCPSNLDFYCTTQILFAVFGPALVFASLAKTVTFDIREREAGCSDQEALLSPSSKHFKKQIVPFLSRRKMRSCMSNTWGRFKEITGGTLHQIAEELLTPPMIAAIFGFFVGAIPQLKFLIIGDNAPLRALQSSITLLGDATLPCVTLLLGANLTRGLRKSALKPLAILAIITVRYVVLPLFGIGLITTAAKLGFLPNSPVYHYVLLIQFALPPAMSIGTMAELLDIGQEECSVIFFWTYLTAALAFTVWSTIFMWILT